MRPTPRTRSGSGRPKFSGAPTAVDASTTASDGASQVVDTAAAAAADAAPAVAAFHRGTRELVAAAVLSPRGDRESLGPVDAIAVLDQYRAVISGARSAKRSRTPGIKA